MVLRLSISKKFILAVLVLSILPLCVLGVVTLENLRALGQRAIDSTTAQLEHRTRESLELRAIELAAQVTQLLRSCEADLLTLRMLARDAEVYRSFSANHRRTIWTREGSNEEPVEVRKEFPLYREVAFIDRDGRERIRIVDDLAVPDSELRDVSKPENTTYKIERYFTETLQLGPDEIYVSHVTGWFVSREQQLQGVEQVEHAVEGRKYEGVVRLAIQSVAADGSPQGIVVLSLDHRHLMELTQHILPTEERFVVFPSYSSGNYAFMFDDEGWIIAHPKFFDIRGVRPDGSEFDPTDPSYSRERLLAGEAPFNLDHVNFINPNYPFISSEVRAGRSGVINTLNVGGVPRVMAYAPIFYDRYPYNKHGVFGGITIGVGTEKFKEPALLTGAKIDEMVRQTKRNSLIILGCTALVAIFIAVKLAGSITRPILELARKARQIASGRISDEVVVQTGDELELLATDFAAMARDINEHRQSLEHSMAELARSKSSVEQYSQALEKQLRVLKNIHFVSQYLGTVYDREQLLDTVLKTCVEGLAYDRSILYLYEPATQRLVCHKTCGFSPEQTARAMAASYHVHQHDTIATKVFRGAETIFVKDVYTDGLATELDRKIAAVSESDCFVFTPIKSREQVIGVLGADTRISRREIRELDVESLEILANDAARAIERSELYGRLVAERNFIKSIVMQMPTGIITLDASLRVTWFNPYGEALFQLRSEDVVGKDYREAFAGVPGWVAVIDQGIGQPPGEDRFHEHRCQMANGGEKILEVHFSVIEQQHQDRISYLIFMRDITRRKQMEEHIRRSDRLVSLGVLAAGIAHEMRNPLTGISLMMDDLHDHLHDRPPERDLIHRSLQEIDRLENLINGLLDFAGPPRDVNFEIRSLEEVVQNTVFLVKKMCKNQSIALLREADGNAPMVRLDPEKLKQALLNLLLNAIQAMPAGGSLRIAVREVAGAESLLAGRAVRITVADSGTGIAPDDLPYIFDPFFSRNPAGCGLGLAIVHTIVEEHRGRISVSSRLSEGTTFRIDLPPADEQMA